MASSTCRESSPSIRRTWSVTPAASANASRKRAARSPPSPPARASVRSTLLCDERPLGDLEDDLRERLLGGHEGGAVTGQALCAKHVRERLAERRAGGCDLRLALPRRQLEGELEPAAAREQPEQVVEDGDAGGDVRAPATGRDPGAHASETSQIEGYQFRRRSPIIRLVRTNPFRSGRSGCGWSIDSASPCWRALRSWAPPWARGTRALGRVAERHRRGLVRERACSRAALERHPARIVRRIGALDVAALRPEGSIERFAQLIAAEPGIVRVERAAARRSRAEPALVSLRRPACPTSGSSRPCGRIRFRAAVAQAAAAVTIAVIDTGADLGAPDLSAKAPQTYSIRSGRRMSPT